jgi:hypothetical protein
MAHEAIHAATHSPGGEDDISATYQQKSQKGATNGYAGLGADGKVPSAQLPAAQAGGVPAGGIVMWHGALASIPEGWALCDGNNGTPDLRAKFVKGAAAAAEPGDTGGAATHQHTYSQVPNHVHPITDPGHTHLTQRYPTTTGGSSGFTADTSMSGTLADNTLPTKSGTTGITATENPTGGVAQGTTDAGSSEPPYYTVAFIMKT